jgi:hypothetical protein
VQKPSGDYLQRIERRKPQPEQPVSVRIAGRFSGQGLHSLFAAEDLAPAAVKGEMSGGGDNRIEKSREARVEIGPAQGHQALGKEQSALASIQQRGLPTR